VNYKILFCDPSLNSTRSRIREVLQHNETASEFKNVPLAVSVPEKRTVTVDLDEIVCKE